MLKKNENESRQTRGINARQLRKVGALPIALVLSLLLSLGIGGPAPAATTTTTAGDIEPFVPPQPTVSAEVPWTSSSTPFNADGVYPEFPMPAGYTEKEYFISGTASIYEYSETGVQVVSPCPASVTGTALPSCSGLPYTTRILVVMPKKARHFSGNVWVNPLNSALGYDFRNEWSRTQQYHVRNGNAYVMWTTSPWAVDALKEIDPQRYAALYWPNNPGPDGENPYFGIAFDIAGQLGRLLKENASDSPLRGYPIDHVFETGFSMDGSITYTQANIFHNLMRMPKGGSIYDGYLPQGTNAQDSLNQGLTAAGDLPAGDPRLRMGPRDAPVIKLNTETELAGWGGGRPVDWRRPDSDARNDRYREWEVPGASHDDQQTNPDPSNMTLYGSVHFPPSGCEHEDPPHVSPTDFRYVYVANAASEALVNWATDGRKPPHAAYVKQTDLSNPSKSTILRDRFGNALGGVRTPQLTVPRSTFNVIDDGPGFLCFSLGWSTPLSDSVLTSLYKSPADYKRRFAAAAKQVVSRGFWLKEDARQAVRELTDLP